MTLQIMMTSAARARLAPRLAAFGPDLEFLSFAPESAGSAQPDILWFSLDSVWSKEFAALCSLAVDAPKPPRWIQTLNAGLDYPIYRQIMARGVRVTKSSAQAPTIAEFVLAHAFSLLAPIDAQRDLQQRGEWAATPFREIGQTRWTLIGYGAIGREIARRLKPFGAHITAVRRTPEGDGGADVMATPAALPSILPQTDVVVMACALNDQTRDMANDAFFTALKPGALFINIGRGALVDDDALRRSLDGGGVAMAVLDVFRIEPLPKDNWMWRHPKIRASAHTSSSGDGVLARGDDLFLENLRRFLAGHTLLNEASPAEVGL